MLIPVYLRSFEKELEKAKKRGLNITLLKEVMTRLIEEKHSNRSIEITNSRETLLDIGNAILLQIGCSFIKKTENASISQEQGPTQTCFRLNYGASE